MRFCMCVLDILDQFFPNLWTFNYWRYGHSQSEILLVNFWKFWIWYFLVYQRIVNLNFLQRRKNLKFFLHFLCSVKNKSLHIDVTKIVWNALIKNSTQLIDLFFLFKRLFCLIIYHCQKFVQSVIPLCNDLLTKFSERQSLFIISDFSHMAVHHSEVENHFNQFLNPHIEFWWNFQLFVSFLFFVLIIIVIVHFYNFVMPNFYLILDHLVVMANGRLPI